MTWALRPPAHEPRPIWGPREERTYQKDHLKENCEAQCDITGRHKVSVALGRMGVQYISWALSVLVLAIWGK